MNSYRSKTVGWARRGLGLALLAVAGTGFAGAAWADSAVSSGAIVGTLPEAIVVITAADLAWNCSEATPQRAHWLADKALRETEYQRAGECYLAAGEHSLADQAFLKASKNQAREDTSHRLASNLSDVKAQARQLKLAFQKH